MNRIQLGNAVFEGENNAYVLEGTTTTLIDTGVALPAVREELSAGLGEFGLSFADIGRIVLTHWHPDHAGLAGEIQAAGGAEVVIHEADAPLVDGSGVSLATDSAQQQAVFERWGIPTADQRRLRRYFESVSTSLAGTAADVTTISDGDVIDADGVALEAVHLPGHTAGLTAFAFDPRTVPDHEPASEQTATTADGVGADGTDGTHTTEAPEALFTGDALLPKYTPNVGGADVRVTDPLAAYAESLARIVDRDVDVAYPGHRWRIDEPSRRAATILDHHRHRTRRVLDVLEATESATAWEVSAQLFGELNEIHILHGPGEAFAHLDHLASAGVVEPDGTAYRLVDPDPDVGSLFPTTPLDDAVDGAEDA